MKIVKPGFVLCILALCAWCGGLFFAQRAEELMNTVSVRWTGEAGVTPVQVERMERWAREDGGTIPAITLWRERAGQALSGKDGQGGAKADVLEFIGSGEVLFPLRFVSGYYPARGDEGGCAVDEQTAVSLWGSGDAVGRELRWQGRTYTVRGVFQGGDGLALIQGREGAEERYAGMLLAVPEGYDSQQLNTFLNANGLEGGEVTDYPLLGWMVDRLAGAPGVVLLLWALCLLVARGWRLRHTPLLMGGFISPALVCGAVALWIGVAAPVPSRVLPTRWSDFAFWADLGRELVRTVGGAMAAPGRREAAIISAVICCALLTLATCCLLGFGLERLRVKTAAALGMGCLCALGVVCGMAVLLAPRGGVEIGRALWLAPSFWLMVGFALERHRAYLYDKKEEKAGETQALPAP